jgi:hypothetical protein
MNKEKMRKIEDLGKKDKKRESFSGNKKTHQIE